MDLHGISFLANFSEEDYKELEKFVREKKYDKDARIFDLYHEARSFFYILDGEVIISKNGTTLAIRKAGDVIGEQAVIDGTPRSATALVAAPIHCIEFSIDVFQSPSLSGKLYRSLLKVLSDKLRQATVVRSISIKREKALMAQVRAQHSQEEFDKLISSLNASLSIDQFV